MERTVEISESWLGRALKAIRSPKMANAGWTLFFLLPYLIGLVVFVAGPIIAAFAISFTRWDILTAPIFIGLKNYQNLIQDELFWQSLYNTLYYIVLIVPAEILLAFFLALAINRSLGGITVYRAVLFMPFVLSLASIGLLWAWLYSPDFGLINYALKSLHLPTLTWLANTTWAMPAIVLTSVWRNAGYYMVIFLAGLQGIPGELYEAANLDGAGPLKRLWHVTIPLLSPTTFFILVIAVIWAFHVFDLTYIMTRGGPSNATYTMVYFIYESGFRWYKMGYASALAFILFAVTMVITIVQFVVQRRWVYYQ
ncbi:MAG: sugar ABC transporter permease [Chloroflexi bacterium]|nr:sugar ABC transporter permease [Chloroflexota bacterium]